MKLTYLGTAAAEGLPALFCDCETCRRARIEGGHSIRTRSGALIDDSLKLDFGPDTYLQMLTRGLDLPSVKSLLITHTHQDHMDTDELTLRHPPFAHPESVPCMTVYGNGRVGRLLETHLNEQLQFTQLRAFSPVRIDDYTVTALEAVHCLSQGGEYPVIFEGRQYFRSEEAFFYLIEKDGRSLLYAHDTDEFTPADMEYLAGRALDFISLDCTNSSLKCTYVGHMGTEDNLRMRDKLLACGAAGAHTVFAANHFSHNGYISEQQLQQELPGFLIAYDGMSVEI